MRTTATPSTSGIAGKRGRAEIARDHGSKPGQAPSASRVDHEREPDASRNAPIVLEATSYAAASDGDDHERDRPDPEQVVEEPPDRLEPAGDAREERLQRALERRRRVGDDQDRQPEQRRHQHQHVGRTPERRLSAGDE